MGLSSWPTLEGTSRLRERRRLFFKSILFLSTLLSICYRTFLQHWKVQADWERERRLFGPVFISFLCSSLYLLISVSSYVIIDIWRQGLFIFISDHLHILSSSYLAKSWSYCNSVFLDRVSLRSDRANEAIWCKSGRWDW